MADDVHQGVVHSPRDRWPLPAAIAFYVGLTGLLIWLGLARTGGTFVYVQDDPYIHLTLARTLADHGVWGIAPSEFAAASSSPLWTVLLAGIRRLGAEAVWWPLVLNIIAGVGLLAVVDGLVRDRVPNRWRASLLIALVLVTPLPTLALIGMEHTLYIVIAVLLSWRLARQAAGEVTPVWYVDLPLAALLVGARYEGVFIVGAGAALLWLRGRRMSAVALAAAGAAPLVLFGLYSVAHGGLILPNSLLMKSGPSRFSTFGSGFAAVLGDWFAIGNLFARPPQLVLTLAGLLVLAVTGRGEREPATGARALAALFVATSVLHACLVKLDWFFRYEAYLMTLGVLSVMLVVAERPEPILRLRRSKNTAAVVAIVLLAIPLALRTLSALAVAPQAMRNVYEQQYQLAMFLGEAYPGATVVVNDIGAVSWYSGATIVDIVGLATQDVADLKRHGRLNPQSLDALVRLRDAGAIAIYEQVFARLIPERWILVGEWTITNNVAVSEDTVGFFATSDASARRLRDALDRYAERLPPSVVYRSHGRSGGQSVAR
jgi:hypothetical protein